MLVHSFESMGARDGEGIRFIVFLSGCPLRCVYCHNPDTWENMGKEYLPEEVVKKVLRYKPYFKNGGGVTFSGGEPLLYPEIIKKIIALCKDKNIPIEINGYGLLKRSIIDENQVCRYQYPYKDFWEFAKTFDVKIVCNSDAHQPECALYGASLAQEFAKNLGIKPTVLSKV